MAPRARSTSRLRHYPARRFASISPTNSRTGFSNPYRRMREALGAKFTQDDDLRQLLLSTGEARLVEAGRVSNAVNRRWGEVNGKGRNMLGVLLMDLRAAVRNESNG